MTASDLLTQWSINVDWVAGCCSPASWPADCGEVAGVFKRIFPKRYTRVFFKRIYAYA